MQIGQGKSLLGIQQEDLDLHLEIDRRQLDVYITVFIQLIELTSWICLFDANGDMYPNLNLLINEYNKLGVVRVGVGHPAYILWPTPPYLLRNKSH